MLTQKRALIWTSLALSLLLAAAAEVGRDRVPQSDAPTPSLAPTARKSRAAGENATAPAAEELRLELLRKPRADARVESLFGAHSWYVAPPAPPPKPVKFVPPSPVPPSAPPLPFAYVGKFQGDAQEKVLVYLAKGDLMFSVAEGDVIEATYRIDIIDQDQVTITYLPLQIKQTLPIGDAS